MPISAIIMLIFGCLVLYGGLGWCLWLAQRRRGPRQDKESINGVRLKNEE